MATDERVPRIGEVKILVKPDYYLGRAHQEQAKGNNTAAIQNYISYLENLANHNDMKLTEQVNLTKLIINLEDAREAEDEIMKCYIVMLNHFPRNVLILNAFAVYLFSRGEYNVARIYLQRAAAEGYLPAEKNLLHVLWHLIPRWHFRMLNDTHRNLSYQSAIRRAIDAGYTNVCDIGAGCGLLTLIAATHSPQVKVTAFEENKTLHGIAERIFKAHDLKNVDLFLKNSNDVAAASCNLIVTEIFDAGLFGEKCLESIEHAIANFVDTDKFKVIPTGGVLYVTAIQGYEITKKMRFVGSLRRLNLDSVCLRDAEPEPYDAENLRNADVKYMSDTKPFLKIDFKDLQLSKKLLSSDDCMEEIDLICVDEGPVHALAVWFDLNLDEETKISTNPLDSKIRCWEQAIFHLTHPIQVDKNEILKLKPKITNSQIEFEVLNHQNVCNQCFEVSKEVISFLNDDKLTESIVRAADNTENCNIRVLDFNVFPLFGFLMAKKGATVYHVYKEDFDLAFFKHVTSKNELDNDKMIFVNERAVEDYMVFMEPPHLVYTDLIKTDGSWNKMQFALQTESKLNSRVIPEKIFLKAQLINSTYLDVCNKVDNDRSLGFKVAEYMNEFSGSEHPDIEHFKYEIRSTVATFDVSDVDVMDLHQEVEVGEDGTVNGIFYWFDMQFTDDPNVTFSTLHSSHYRKCCTIFDKRRIFAKDDKVMIHILRTEGQLKVYCD